MLRNMDLASIDKLSEKTFFNQTQEDLDESRDHSVINISNQKEEGGQKYMCKMPVLEEVEITEQIRNLTEAGIRWLSTNFEKEFKIKLLRNNWESTLFEVSYGQLQLELSVLKIKFPHTKYLRNFVTEGNFGRVYRITHQHKDLAVKTIKCAVEISEESRNKCFLMEVFFSKIASALKVGPKFSSVFGYDAIFEENELQFAIQYCNIDKVDQITSDDYGSIKKMLRILHQFHIIHGDIKIDNLAWSQSFEKFVFIDYGLSKIVTQKIGEKTLTGFFGTLGYASEQMSKLYLLNDKKQIDLYFNDVHCLHRTAKKIKKQNGEAILEGFINLIKMADYRDKLISFFRFKYFLFFQKYDEMEEIVKEKEFPKTYRSILYHELKSQNCYYRVDSSPQKVKRITQLLSYLEISQNEASESYDDEDDLKIFQYILQLTQGKIILFSSMSKMRDFAVSNNQQSRLFQECWGKKKWMEDLFHFIDPNNPLSSSDVRKKMIAKMFAWCTGSRISRTRQLSDTYMFRICLEHLLEFFQSKPLQNARILEKMASFFYKLGDEKNRRKAQSVIVNSLQGEQYLLKNMEFFIAKIFNTLHDENFSIEINKENINKFIPQNKIQENMCKACKSFIEYVYWLQSTSKQNNLDVNPEKFVSWLEQFSDESSNTLRLLCSALSKKFNNEYNSTKLKDIVTEMELRNSYLRACIDNFSIFYKIDNRFSYNHILKELLQDPFYKDYESMIHAYLYLLLGRKDKSKVICQESKYIYEEHIMCLNREYYSTFIQSMQEDQWMKMVIEGIKNIPLADIVSEDGCGGVFNVIFFILAHFSDFAKCQSRRPRENYFINKIIEISDLLLTMTDGVQLQKRILFQKNMVKFIFLHLKKQYAESVALVISIYDSDETYIFLSYISQLHLFMTPNQLEWLKDHLIRAAYQLIDSKNFTIFQIVRSLLRGIVIRLIKIGASDQGFLLLKLFCQFLTEKKINSQMTGLDEACNKFCRYCDFQILKDIVRNFLLEENFKSIRTKLNCFASFLFNAYLNLESFLQNSERRKLLIFAAICLEHSTSTYQAICRALLCRKILEQFPPKTSRKYRKIKKRIKIWQFIQKQQELENSRSFQDKYRSTPQQMKNVIIEHLRKPLNGRSKIGTVLRKCFNNS